MLFAFLFAFSQPLCGAEAFAHYAELLQIVPLERVDYEKAAFLLQEPDGQLRTLFWNDREIGVARYTGAMPAHCIAVIHTHPVFLKEPSLGDRREAQRIALPIVVITPQAVTVAWPDGTTSYLVDGLGWAARPQPARR
jgi:proteasome lid subunit RPN8/RPN11